MTDEIIGWREDGTPFRADEFKKSLLDSWGVNPETFAVMFGPAATKESVFDAVSRAMGGESVD